MDTLPKDEHMNPTEPQGVMPEVTPMVEPMLQTPALAEHTVPLLAPVPFYRKRSLVLSILVAILILGGAGYYAYANYYAHGGTVAVVNGTRIYRDAFNESIELMKQGATQQGQDITQESVLAEINKNALDVLINNTLLITASKKAGFSVTPEEIQAKYDELVTNLGNAEELAKRMKDVGLTEAKLRSNIEERIFADKYIESVSDIKKITVSDQEVKDFLATNVPAGTKLPPMDQIRPEIEARITATKQQEIVATLLEKLRGEAKIETRI